MKKLITSIVLGVVLATSATVGFAAGNENGEKEAKIIQGSVAVSTINDDAINITDCNWELPSFKEYMEGMKEFLKDIPKTDLTKLEKVYNEIDALEDAKKFDESCKKWDEFNEVLEKYYKEDFKVILKESMELPSFKVFMGDMKDFLKDIPKTESTSLEKLYNEINTLEKAEKYDEADKKWGEFNKKLETYFKEDATIIEGCSIELPSFKVFMGGMKDFLKEIPKTDLTTLEKLYNEIDALEKAEKFDEADKKWEAFNKIFDKYLNEKVMINTFEATTLE